MLLKSNLAVADPGFKGWFRVSVTDQCRWTFFEAFVLRNWYHEHNVQMCSTPAPPANFGKKQNKTVLTVEESRWPENASFCPHQSLNQHRCEVALKLMGKETDWLENMGDCG